MEDIIYKVVVCDNRGEKPYYILIRNSGEFTNEEFDNDEFTIFNDNKISDKFKFLLGETCVTSLQRLDPESKEALKIKDKIKIENTFDVSDIKLFYTCEECNKIGYGLELPNGTLFYPTNSDDFEGFEGKYVKVEIDGVVTCAKVFTYKYHTKEREMEARLIEGCYQSLLSCEKEQEELKEEYCIGREVSPDVLTKNCCSC